MNVGKNYDGYLEKVHAHINSPFIEKINWLYIVRITTVRQNHINHSKETTKLKKLPVFCSNYAIIPLKPLSK